MSNRGPHTRRGRILGVAIVAAFAALSVGATAYAADHGQSAETTAVETPTNAPITTPSASPVATPVVTPAPVPTVVPTVEPSAELPAEPTDPIDGGASDEGTTDGNVVEVRTPNPDAIPTTIAEREYFYGLVTECMATMGFDWRAEITATADGEFAGVNMTRAGSVELSQQEAFTLALDGDTGAGDYYHWADAGCWGYAVHVTGNDGNN